MNTKSIVLLHGWGANTSKLRPLANHLRDLGWNTFLLKIPGFDLPEPNEVWGLKEYAEYVHVESLKKFGGREYYVFGHSFGGRIAIKLASSNRAQVKGIVLCAAAGISRGNGMKRNLFMILAKFGKVFNLIPYVAKLWQRLLYKAVREHDYEKASKKMRLIMKKVISEDLKIIVPSINRPVLILWGRKDKLTPLKDAKYLNKNINESTLCVFDKEGHKLPYTKPKEIVVEIEKWYKSIN